MELDADMERVVTEQQLGFVATVSPEGRPNLSPKGTTFVVDGSRILFADVASPNTVANLAANPNVELNIVDPIVRKGYRFKGTATVHVDDDWYGRGIAMLAERGSSLTEADVNSIVVVDVTEADSLISPAYGIVAADGQPRSERTIAAGWLARINERYRARFDL